MPARQRRIKDTHSWHTRKQAARPGTAAIRRPKRLGVKRFGGEHVIPGNILCRQRGTQWHPGTGVGMGTDHTIFAVDEGKVQFETKRNGRIYISVRPEKAHCGRVISVGLTNEIIRGGWAPSPLFR